MAAPIVATPPEQESEPWPAPRQIAWRWLVFVLLLALDLWSKAYVVEWLEASPPPEGMTYDRHGHHRFELFGEWFSFMVTYNPGMAWGFDKLPSWLLVGGRCAAVLFLAYLVTRTSPAKRMLSAALTLIFSGAAGNLYDNLFLTPRRVGAKFGEVRDFIDVYFAFSDWHFPTFNVADACISVGACLLLFSSFVGPHKGHASKSE